MLQRREQQLAARMAHSDSAVAVDSFSEPGLGDGARELDASARRHVMSARSHFELQRGPSPNIAHSFFASPESPLAQVGMWAISSAVAEQRTIAQPQLSFCYFACLTL